MHLKLMQRRAATVVVLLMPVAAPAASTGSALEIREPAGQIERLDARTAASVDAVDDGIASVDPELPPPRELLDAAFAARPVESPAITTARAVATTEAPLIGGGSSFLAVPDDNTRIPPDVMGAVGPAHLVSMLNTEVRVQLRDGTLLSAMSLVTFWTSGTGLSGTPFDPRILYDHASGRWIATVDANARSGTSEVWLAISTTSNPLAGWRFYGFPADPAHPSGSTWADFPGLGVNGTWIAVTNNMFTLDGSFVGAKMWVVDKTSALVGGALTVTIFPTGFDVDPTYGTSGFSLQPAITYDPSPFLYFVDGGSITVAGLPFLRMSRLSGTGASPTWTPVAGSAFAGTGIFPVVNDFDLEMIDAEQLGVPSTCSGGSTDGLACRSSADCDIAGGGACRRVDTGDARIPGTSVFRNGRLWTAHAGGLPRGAVDRTAVFWYALDPAAMEATGDAIAQSGVVDGGPGVHHFYPSLAVNRQEDVLLAFSRSDASRFVEAAATGRSAGDPAGAVSPIVVLKAGEGGYVKTFTGSRNRWGDYTATTVDAGDDLSFWTIQQYAAAPVGGGANDARWGTWWTETPVTPGPTTTTTTIPRIGVTASKLLIVDDRLSSGHARAVLAAKDAGITKGAGVDPAAIEAEVRIAYDGASGAFFVPSGWASNSATGAKYLNRDAPAGPTQVKRLIVKPARTIKLLAKGLGDVGLDLRSTGAPSGSVFGVVCITNASETFCHCTEFPACVYTPTSGGATLQCRDGIADPACVGLDP